MCNQSIYSHNFCPIRNKRERRFRRTIEPTRSSSSTEKTSLILGEEELGENYRQALEEERRRRGGSGGSEGQGVAGGIVRCCSTINAAAKVSVLAAACFMFGGAILHGMGTQVNFLKIPRKGGNDNTFFLFRVFLQPRTATFCSWTV